MLIEHRTGSWDEERERERGGAKRRESKTASCVRQDGTVQRSDRTTSGDADQTSISPDWTRRDLAGETWQERPEGLEGEGQTEVVFG